MTVETDNITRNEALDFLQKACALFSTTPKRPELVICPYCSREIAETWQPLFSVTTSDGTSKPEPEQVIRVFRDDKGEERTDVEIRWMECPSTYCRELIVQARRAIMSRSSKWGGAFIYGGYEAVSEDTWIAVPKRALLRPIDPLVPETFRQDYTEACLILEDSPRMSAVLSRRILSALLEQYAGHTEKRLTSQIDKFLATPGHPSRILDNLHHLREMGDFGAHTQNDAQGKIINVSYEEEAWTLTVIEGLFDFFVIAPAKDEERREAFEQKMRDAGRKPFPKSEP